MITFLRRYPSLPVAVVVGLVVTLSFLLGGWAFWAMWDVQSSQSLLIAFAFYQGVVLQFPGYALLIFCEKSFGPLGSVAVPLILTTNFCIWFVFTRHFVYPCYFTPIPPRGVSASRL